MLKWSKKSPNEHTAVAGGTGGTGYAVERWCVGDRVARDPWVAEREGDRLRDGAGHVRFFWSLAEAKAACEADASWRSRK